ncbi:GNAT family N-acetyltransferase [Agromyces cerinus subsp. nitratus]|uniref:GNAT family N-acetyltransferase n=2 Tax=Agromyces cerinus TaxID=33878 RepID=UPI003631AF69
MPPRSRGMLTGELVTLAPVRQADLPAFYEAQVDLGTRGAYFPLTVVSEPVLAARFAATGFWERDEGTLLIRVRADDARIIGHIEFFIPVNYWDAYELSYQLYDPAQAGRGYVTEAVQLLVDHLFGTKKKHRIQLVIVPENGASRRIAEKCGFMYEGVARGAFFNAGTNHDVAVYSLLRTDARPWRTSERP